MKLHLPAIYQRYLLDMTRPLSTISPIRQTGILSAIAVLMSFFITGSLHLITFGMDERFWSAMVLAITVPWGISVPLGFYMSKQHTKLMGVTNRLKIYQDELREVNKELEYRANYDPMTGLPNRQAFFNRIEEERAKCERSILMIIDVDHFKNINDSFGHPIGDDALQLLSNVFRQILRQGDLIGRIGGEEFGILLPDTGVTEGQIIGETIRREIEATTFEPHKGVRHVITVSAGLTVATPHHDREVLMHHADVALFTAKRRGRNQVVLFEPGMRTKPRPFYDVAQSEKAKFGVSNGRVN